MQFNKAGRETTPRLQNILDIKQQERVPQLVWLAYGISISVLLNDRPIDYSYSLLKKVGLVLQKT